jgi:uncharacterized protein (TIGR02246 family)
MGDDEQEIRDLIHTWATAVHAGDLEGVLADHTEDVVMFDVPPPNEGVRGIDAYRETWPPFFKWQRSGEHRSRSSRSTSPPVKTWPSRGPSSAAGQRTNSEKIRTIVCA